MGRKKKRKKKTSTLSRLRNNSTIVWWIQVATIILFCTASYFLWLDHRILTKFEGHRWKLPARIFASPLELYSGLNINKLKLKQELDTLGYHQVNQLTAPGEYQLSANSIGLANRSFRFWDGVEKSRQILVSFTDDRIDSLVDFYSSNDISLVRLDPQLIGKIYPDHNEDRVLIPYENVPPVLVDTIIAVEDRNFYNHIGVDPKGILRAIWVNIRETSLKQGGSTLTQQLVKNFYLSQERTFWRKFNELIMSILLEWRYSKSEILAAYINEVYLGQHGARAIHGFGTAAEYYFTRPLQELNASQIALLVGLIRGASYYNPRRNPERSLQRRNLVLKMMFGQGILTGSEYKKAKSADLQVLKQPGWSSAKYPAFLDLVVRQLRRDYRPEDLRSAGLRIFTTLNPIYQDIADKAVQRRLKILEAQKNLTRDVIETAAVIAHVDTGEILAMVGGRDTQISGFNRALDAKRPIGSLIKPAVYLTALLKPEKFNVLSLLKDTSVRIKQNDGSIWSPKNYSGKVHGDVCLYKALAKSYNLATIRLGMQVGVEDVIKTLRQLGITNEIPAYPSLFLGTLELSPLQVTQIYQTLASGGFQVPLKTIREILDKSGRPLQRYSMDIKQTIDPRSVFLVRFLLSEVVKNGTAKALLNRLPGKIPLAGKTGTTNDLRDSWFAGFGDNILSVIWIGRDDNRAAGLTGAEGALQVWADIMANIDVQPLTLNPPHGVHWTDSVGDIEGAASETIAKRFPFIEPHAPDQAGLCQTAAGSDI